MNSKYRIACHGWVAQNSGSLASANFLILKELLQRGFEIDFYGWGSIGNEAELLAFRNYKYNTVPDKSIVRAGLNYLPKKINQLVTNAIYPLVHLLWIYNADNRVLNECIQIRHKSQPYNLILFLGLYAPFRIENIPVISWPQGHPKSNWLLIRKLKNKIISLCGIVLYIKLMIFYFLRSYRANSEIKNSDSLICGSEWSKSQLVLFGVPDYRVFSIPYPMNLEFFQQHESYQKSSNVKKFLWLGRSEPRKRLDLLLEAYQLLLEERDDIFLEIIGGFGWAEGYKKLIDEFKFQEYLNYQPYLERQKIPELLSRCDILVQPSEGEDFGSSVAEAMCCGLTVIVGPTNGTKDYINPSSFVFESYDPVSLKNTMQDALLALEKEPKMLAQEAIDTAKETFAIAQVIDSLVEIFPTNKYANSTNRLGMVS